MQWVEFAFGPPMLEAMRVGSIDIGLVGDTPPIFAQAAKSDLLYIAAVPSGASAILLPAGSALQTLQDLKGRKIALAKGSSSHNLAIAAIEKAELNFTDVQPIYLAPADTAAAFERGAVDAWTIWDPYYALYESRPGVRVLAESTAITPQNFFFIGSPALWKQIRASPPRRSRNWPAWAPGSPEIFRRSRKPSPQALAWPSHRPSGRCAATRFRSCR